MSGQISSIMEQLIVFEQLVCRIMTLHALRTDEALKHRSTSSEPAGYRGGGKKSMSVKINHESMLPQMSVHGSGLCWVAPNPCSESPPSRESEEEKTEHYYNLLLFNECPGIELFKLHCTHSSEVG